MIRAREAAIFDLYMGGCYVLFVHVGLLCMVCTQDRAIYLLYT